MSETEKTTETTETVTEKPAVRDVKAEHEISNGTEDVTVTETVEKTVES